MIKKKKIIPVSAPPPPNLCPVWCCHESRRVCTLALCEPAGEEVFWNVHQVWEASLALTLAAATSQPLNYKDCRGSKTLSP